MNKYLEKIAEQQEEKRSLGARVLRGVGTAMGTGAGAVGGAMINAGIYGNSSGGKKLVGNFFKNQNRLLEYSYGNPQRASRALKAVELTGKKIVKRGILPGAILGAGAGYYLSRDTNPN